MGADKKQDKISLSFSKEKEIEQKLYKWVIKKGEIVGVASIIKQILYKKGEKPRSLYGRGCKPTTLVFVLVYIF